MDRSRRIIPHKRYHTSSADETFALGRTIGEQLPPQRVIALFGELAAGKTTFIKGLACGAAQIDPTMIQSPTFTYLNIYQGTKPFFHFDLYRLRDIDEFLSMGFDEYFDAEGICCIEWSERIASYLPKNSLRILLEHVNKDERLIIVDE